MAEGVFGWQKCEFALSDKRNTGFPLPTSNFDLNKWVMFAVRGKNVRMYRECNMSFVSIGYLW